MRKQLLFMISLFNIYLIFGQDNVWQTYELDSLIIVDLPGDVYEFDTIINDVELYQMYSIVGTTTFTAQKIRVEEGDLDENLSTLPHDSISLDKFYKGAIKGVVRKAPGKLVDSEDIFKNGYKGYKLTFVDSLENKIFITEQYLLNRHIYSISVVNFNSIDIEESEKFFKSFWIEKDNSITQFFGQPRDYKVGYLLGQGLAYLAVIGLVIWLVVRVFRK